MPTKRRSGVFLFIAVLVVVAGVTIAVWRGTGPLPDPPGCTATVNGRTVDLAPDQAENASLIAAIGVRRGLPARAVSIALATAYQESKIRNLTHGDRDSVGIFQQRPSQGWGSVAQISDEHYAINRFYDALEKIDGYQTMRITEAAQKVQRSGFPEAYEDHAPDARALASALTGFSPGGTFTCVARRPDGHGTASNASATLTKAYGDLDVARTGRRQDFTVTVAAGEDGNRKGWSIAQFVVAHADALHVESVAFDGRAWKTGRESEKGWVASRASTRAVTVSLA
ncbi:MAG TPA: hypothetical protein VFE07_10735 [Marmoricola sp.]|nr:hypothetical protein [Marmoricola sp.]